MLANQLFKEGFDEKTVFEVGDIMYDAVLHFGKQEFQSAKLKSFGIDGPFVLATIHRAENTDSSRRLSSIVSALEKVKKIVPLFGQFIQELEKFFQKKESPQI